MVVHRTLLFIALFLLLVAPGAAQSAAGDEAAIRQVIDRLEEAFQKRDAALYAANFTEDADWENAFGGRENGRVNIERRLSAVYTVFQEAGRELKEIRVRLLTPETAVADRDRLITGQIGYETGQPLPPRRVRETMVLVKRDGEWKIAVFRVSDLRASVEVR